ncbi:MAG: translation initiation factor IF-2 [Candidatus Nanoarchaeia archaeon]|nr:translation initiation factor IF-2 [Candidatus Nanoarchaeia archaeon]MDD5239483.1 translation initiation factor IF-2 [Candidatus Nanoarchaeia archaeon]
MAIRQPIISVVGHIDHGKTTILDKLRGTAVAKREAGAITQHIGATEVPIDAIKKATFGLIDKLNIKLTIPGFLMIDTPGHEAFSNLRKRGGSISDIAVLVVDINEGFKAQTREALEVLKQFKVPFVVAANKIDLIDGWQKHEEQPFMKSFAEQPEHVKEELDNQLYKLVIALSDYGVNSERFDRVNDYTKQVAIIPCSGLTKEGIPELLMVLTGLAQKYLENQLKIEVSGPARGSIIEIKDEKGLGKTIDVILYAGTLDVGDTIVMPGLNEPIVTKVRALLKPSPMKELREKGQFLNVKSVTAAAGIKISAPGLDNAVAGMPVWEVQSKAEEEQAKKELQKEIKTLLKASDEEGAIIRADSIGAIEALTGLMKKINVPIRKAAIGDLTKTDVIEAKRIAENNPLIGVIFTFNVKIPKDVEQYAKEHNVKIFSSNIVYSIYEDYLQWKYQQETERRSQALAKLIWPAKIKLLKGFVFRQCNPAVVGVEVLAGRIRTKVRLIKTNGKEIGEIHQLQSEGENISEAKAGQKIAVSIQGPTIGRTIKEDETLYVFVPRSNIEIIESEFAAELSADEIQTLREFKEIIEKHEDKEEE